MDTVLKQKIVNAVKEGKQLGEVTKGLYITEYQLRLLLKAWGVEIPGKREYHRIPMPPRDELMKTYDKYRTTQKVAIHYGTGINTVNRWMKVLKIPTRRMKTLTENEKVKFLEEHLEKLGDIQL